MTPKEKADYSSIQRICKNCMDYDKNTNTCTIRFLIKLDRTKTPLPRNPNQKGCDVFMQTI